MKLCLGVITIFYIFILSSCLEITESKTFIFILESENFKNPDIELKKLLSLNGYETMCNVVPSRNSKIILAQKDKISIQDAYQYNFFEKFVSSRPDLLRFRKGYEILKQKNHFGINNSIDTINSLISDKNSYIITISDHNYFKEPLLNGSRLAIKENFTSKEVLQAICDSINAYDLFVIDLTDRHIANPDTATILKLEQMLSDPFKLIIKGLPDGDFSIDINENGITNNYSSVSNHGELLIVFNNINWSIPDIHILSINNITSNKIISFKIN